MILRAAATKGRILEAIRAAGVPTHRDLRHEHESLRVEEIAETVGVAPATVRKWARELEREGLIEIEKQERWGGDGRLSCGNMRRSFFVYRAVACRSCDGRGIGCDACDGEGAALAEPDEGRKILGTFQTEPEALGFLEMLSRTGARDYMVDCFIERDSSSGEFHALDPDSEGGAR